MSRKPRYKSSVILSGIRINVFSIYIVCDTCGPAANYLCFVASFVDDFSPCVSSRAPAKNSYACFSQ